MLFIEIAWLELEQQSVAQFSFRQKISEIVGFHQRNKLARFE